MFAPMSGYVILAGVVGKATNPRLFAINHFIVISGHIFNANHYIVIGGRDFLLCSACVIRTP